LINSLGQSSSGSTPMQGQGVRSLNSNNVPSTNTNPNMVITQQPTASSVTGSNPDIVDMPILSPSPGVVQNVADLDNDDNRHVIPQPRPVQEGIAPMVAHGDGESDITSIPSVVLRDRNIDREDDNEVVEEEYHGSQKISDIFRHSRVDPILQSTAELLGLECNDSEDDKAVGSLFYSSIGQSRVTGAPILRMPNEIAIAAKKARATNKKKRVRASAALNKLFHVTREDYDDYFALPKLDEDVAHYLKGPKFAKVPQQFSYFWEHELKDVDDYVRLLSRLSAFQLTILDSLAVGLAPTEDDKDTSKFETAKLLVDISSQVLSKSVQLSYNVSNLRRENVCAGLRQKFTDDMVDKLFDVPYEEDVAHLFAGGFYKTMKDAAKKIQNVQSLEKAMKPVSKPGPSRFDSRKGSGYSGARNSAQYFSNKDRGSSSGYDRGIKRKAHDEPQVGRSRGTGFKRGRGGRGRGRAQSRF